MSWRRAALVCCGPLLLALPARAAGQAISPGKLSSAHAGLEGVRGCTRCHELGTPGVSGERCLACHAPLHGRIQQGRGLHARVAADECGDCHKEHFGREARLVRLDTATFDHGRTGHALAGAHATAACRACHRPELVSAPDVRHAVGTSLSLERTFLGLGTACADCHARHDPHGNQFPNRACAACHTETGWRPAANFDHERARFRLTGRHQQAACGACHRPRSGAEARAARYVGLQYATCRSCHEDPHRGAMGIECAQCHGTAGWTRVPTAIVATRFNHAGTRFSLQGAHARLSCRSCHGGAPAAGIRIRFAAGTETHSYPRPAGTACTACHLDPHEGVFANRPGAGSCTSCHTEDSWRPSAYDAARHAGTSFPLTGAHAAVPCVSCHPAERQGAARFRSGDRSCRACHAAQDPHAGAFGARGCDGCHDTGTFHVAVWDHAREPALACRSCHAARDPHGTQFGDRGCGDCHRTTTFAIADFDHARTHFPLEGRHAGVACAACHVLELAAGDSVERVRYRPLSTRCEDCHGGGS